MLHHNKASTLKPRTNRLWPTLAAVALVFLIVMSVAAVSMAQQNQRLVTENAQLQAMVNDPVAFDWTPWAMKTGSNQEITFSAAHQPVDISLKSMETGQVTPIVQNYLASIPADRYHLSFTVPKVDAAPDEQFALVIAYAGYDTDTMRPSARWNQSVPLVLRN